ncbi:CLUMA_CG011866, isoform A [Clunio marinus]|uniref:CLUMA_CG011866, isoform A n=1 Tax=Clunio marinus TaxID=568069 RepID=A0A1J1IHJ7_9DIPT|nr:CLUMA_CG011866, isoform A [Clunio marinus]
MTQTCLKNLTVILFFHEILQNKQILSIHSTCSYRSLTSDFNKTSTLGKSFCFPESFWRVITFQWNIFGLPEKSSLMEFGYTGGLFSHFPATLLIFFQLKVL